jgi:hypothetical protein
VRQVVVQSSHWSFGRTILISAAIAGATGAATGAISVGSAFDLAAELFFGGLGGLLVGATFGALASGLALLVTWLLRQSGVRELSILRVAFVLCGTVIILTLATLGLPPQTGVERTASLAALSMIPLISGAWVARHSIRVRE